MAIESAEKALSIDRRGFFGFKILTRVAAAISAVLLERALPVLPVQKRPH